MNHGNSNCLIGICMKISEWNLPPLIQQMKLDYRLFDDPQVLFYFVVKQQGCSFCCWIDIRHPYCGHWAISGAGFLV